MELLFFFVLAGWAVRGLSPNGIQIASGWLELDHLQQKLMEL